MYLTGAAPNNNGLGEMIRYNTVDEDQQTGSANQGAPQMFERIENEAEKDYSKVIQRLMEKNERETEA